tara:strand:- start:284 stop:514 length:231 start_codon:yes stop_codon:yes gene_type:complete
MSKIQIKDRYGDIVYQHECENNTIKLTLEKAVSEHANLRCADLWYTYIGGANPRDVHFWNAGGLLREIDASTETND